MLGNEEKELSNLVQRSEVSGSMWLHMIFSCGFNDADSLPFTQLRHDMGNEKWGQLKENFYGTEEMETFVVQKLSQLMQYEEDLTQAQIHQAKPEPEPEPHNKKMTWGRFIATSIGKTFFLLLELLGFTGPVS